MLQKYQKILKLLNNHSSSWLFKKPVNIKEIPDYYEVIKHPMDLETIGKKVAQGQYRTKEMFVADVQLIFFNAKTYNMPNSIYYKYTVNLEEFIQTHLDNLMKFDESATGNYVKCDRKNL